VMEPLVHEPSPPESYEADDAPAPVPPMMHPSSGRAGFDCVPLPMSPQEEAMEQNLKEIEEEMSPKSSPEKPRPSTTTQGNITLIDIGDKSGWVEDTKAKGGMAGIMVEENCAKVYNDVRRTRNGLRWCMYKFDKSCSWIIPVAQCAASDNFEQDWFDFVEQLPDDASAYAVYNFDYNEKNGRYSDGDSTNVKSRFCLFAWSPKGCGVKQKMLSATSVKAIKEVCKGTVEAAIHDKAECEWDNICSVLRIDANPISRATFGAHDGW